MNKLVEYSSSESEDESSSKPAPAVACAMKLPMLLKVETSAHKDSPSDHQNRTRQIPHVEGNWATHVFIDC